MVGVAGHVKGPGAAVGHKSAWLVQAAGVAWRQHLQDPEYAGHGHSHQDAGERRQSQAAHPVRLSRRRRLTRRVPRPRASASSEGAGQQDRGEDRQYHEGAYGDAHRVDDAVPILWGLPGPQDGGRWLNGYAGGDAAGRQHCGDRLFWIDQPVASTGTSASVGRVLDLLHDSLRCHARVPGPDQCRQPRDECSREAVPVRGPVAVPA